MEEKQIPLIQVIDMALLPEAEVLHANLARLSCMDAEAMEHFKEQWKKTAAGQRLRLISSMVSLSEDDLALDFTAVFRLGVEDAEENIRIKALEGLELEDKHTFIRPIIKTLRNDESETVRITAAKALGKFALMAEMDELPDVVGQVIFNALLEVLEKPGEPLELRRRALESISPFQQELIERYIEDYYYNEDPKVKASAVYAMGHNCNPRWISFVIDEMLNSDSEIRFEAARASGELEDEEAISPLLRLLDDEDAEVQEAAITALGKIGGQDAKKALQQLIYSEDARIKSAALSALAELQACEDPLSLNF
jgi:HEAT repeat protein